MISDFRMSGAVRAAAVEAKDYERKLDKHVEGEVLVKLKPGVGLTDMDGFAADYGSELKEQIKMPSEMRARFKGELLRLDLPEGVTTAQAILAMKNDPRVEYAASNDILHLNAPVKEGDSVDAPADLSQKLWGMHNTGQNGGTPDVDIDGPEGWAITQGTRQGPIVAVIDTGVDYNHKTLSNNIWTNPQDGTHGYNAINDSHDPMDDHYHGTHCAGSIAGNGTDGVYGVVQQAQLMPIKFLSASGGGTLADAVKALSFAAENGARITSNSWGGGGYNQALKDAIASAPGLHIFAAGNESNNNDASPAYPASYEMDNIVSVAASDRNDRLASFSNYGATTVDLAAPGVDIWSTAPNNKYKSLDGTSMATPHVSGAAIAIVSKYPEITNEQLKARLMNAVDDVPGFHGKMITGGRLNLAAALKDDTVAPGQVGGFAATVAKAGRVTLGWTAAGDDDQVGGKAAAYQLRVSDKPIVDGPAGEGQTSFDDARPVNVGRPGEPGSQESATVDLPLSGEAKTWYFAIKSSDKVGNVSGIATASADVPAANIAWADNGDPANWTNNGTWGQVEVDGRTGVWTDSPDGDYGNNANTALTSQPISLAGLSAAKLIFDEKHATENKYDKVHVQASTDGKTWNTLKSFTGNGGWATQTVDLSAYDGQSVQIRFNLTSDGSMTADGFYLANVVVAGG